MDTWAFNLAALGLVISALASLAALASVVMARRNLQLLERERIAAHRQYLYEKQFEGYAAIMPHLTNAFEYVSTIELLMPLLRENEIEDMRNKLENMSTNIRETGKHWAIVLPDEINQGISILQLAAFNIKTMLPHPKYELEGNMELLSMVIKDYLSHYQTLVQAIRARLGVDPMSRETFDLFREIPQQRNRPK